MRDLIVVLIFTYGAVLTLRRPYVGALLWVWIGLMNPHRMGWGFAYSLPFALIAIALVVLSMSFNSKQVRWPGGGPLTVLMLLIVWMGVTTLAAILLEPSLSRYVEVLKVLCVLLVLASVVRTREEIVGFAWVVAASMGFFGLKGGFFTLITGGSFRVWGPPASVVEGNNELAVALVMTIPLLYYLAQQSALSFSLPVVRRVGGKWLRRGLYAAMVLSAFAALGSHSRGALLAMIAMASMFWWRSKSKLMIGLALVALAPLLVMFMPSEWFSRMETIQSYQADESAMGRINAWTMAINIANSRITGAGFATDSPIIYHAYAPNPNFVIVAHSIYFQILGEHGYIGLALYLLFWGLTLRTSTRVIKLAKGLPDAEWAVQLASMIKVALIGFAVGGAFLSLAYWDMPFYYMIILVVTERWVKDRLEEQKSRPAGAALPSQPSSSQLQVN